MDEYQILKPIDADGLLTNDELVLVGESSEIPQDPSNCRLVIGDLDAPLYVFTADEIVSVTGVNTVDLAGSQLSVDQITPIARYQWMARRVLQLTDYDGMLTTDGKILCGEWNASPSDIPYATPVWYYDNDLLQGKYYVEHVERVAADQWSIHGVSVVGLLDLQTHRGGVYMGTLFIELLQEFFGGVIGESMGGMTPITGGLADCYVEDQVAITTVHGMLPYATKRQNLHQLIFAYVVNLTKTETGDLIFAYLKNDLRPEEIPPDRLYIEGSVNYTQPVTDVEVTEYTYVYDDTVEPEKVYDNVSAPHVQGEALVLFKSPINPETITTSEPTMIVRDANEVSAYVRGNGIITAIPYQVQSRILSRSTPPGGIRKTVKTTSVTMINPLNSNNVITRLFDYYTQSRSVSAALVAEGERVGALYNYRNPYGDFERGFIHKMSWTRSGITRADCQIIANYSPTGVSTNMQNMILLTGSGVWEVPSGLRKSDSPYIRAVLIAGGQGGHGGHKGEDSERHPDSPGEGGLGGVGGQGGRVYTVDIDVRDIASIDYYCGLGGVGGRSDKEGEMGEDTTFGEYSTYYGAIAPGGIMNLMNGRFYARKGATGYAGMRGGLGVAMRADTLINEAVAKQGDNGEDFVLGDKKWRGGRGSRGNSQGGGGPEGNLAGWAFGGGGGGAAYGAKGIDATPGHVQWQAVIGGFGGEGATALIHGNNAKNVGCGGDGGHGGGGGGAPGDAGWTKGSAPTGYYGPGGYGSIGGRGGNGGILIYY